MYDNIKEDSATTAVNIKLIIELLKNYIFCLVNIWENKESCENHYRCATSLYLLYILSQAFDIFIYRGISALGRDIEGVDCLNDKYKRFIFHLMDTVQLNFSQRFIQKWQCTHQHIILL